jgi:predicted nucleic acid-binding Zn ribbon protein
MNTEMLKVLEQAMEPYRRAGFVITSQSEGAITLVAPRAGFNYLLFIILLLIWPLALIYLISFNNRGSRGVCLRVTSQGEIEASGYTLERIERERRRRRQDYLIATSVGGLLIVAVVLFLKFY